MVPMLEKQLLLDTGTGPNRVTIPESHILKSSPVKSTPIQV